MHMCINEAGHDETCVAHGLLLNFGNLAVFDFDDTREYLCVNEVNDLASDGETVVHE